MSANDETPSLALAFEQYRREVAASMGLGAVSGGAEGGAVAGGGDTPGQDQNGQESGVNTRDGEVMRHGF